VLAASPPLAGLIVANGSRRRHHERMRTPLPPVACVVSFVDAVNRGDVDRLADLMHDEHRVQVLDEPPLDGKAANATAWNGYVTSFPHYVIHPHRIVAHGDDVVVLGHTTGSHLGLPDAEESRLTVIWRATVRDGLVLTWQIVEDTPEHRRELGVEEV
jgi:ketosteroid isomerase-like protein